MARTTNRKLDGEKTRVLIVDDHMMLRQGIKAVLETEPDLMACGEADSRISALEAMESTHPDLALVDLNLKNSNGLELIKDLQIRSPGLKVLVISAYDESFYAERVLRAGAHGYLTKEEGMNRLLEAIRLVLAGKPCLSENVAASIIRKSMGGTPQPSNPSHESLSDRELEILELLGSGFVSREIAKSLNLSIKTVESHREHIKQKLGLRNAAQLVKYAFHWIQCKKWPDPKDFAALEPRPVKPD